MQFYLSYILQKQYYCDGEETSDCQGLWRGSSDYNGKHERILCINRTILYPDYRGGYTNLNRLKFIELYIKRKTLNITK